MLTNRVDIGNFSILPSTDFGFDSVYCCHFQNFHITTLYNLDKDFICLFTITISDDINIQDCIMASTWHSFSFR